MKSILVYLLSLVMLALCARTSPIPSSPPPPLFRRFRLTRAPEAATLERRSSPVPTEAIEEAESAVAHAISNDVKKTTDRRKHIIIATGIAGLVLTTGWTYVAVKSFVANRAKYLQEQKRLEAEKRKPPPTVGDIICTVDSYYTPHQVQTRRPTSTRSPCYRLSDGAPVQVAPSVAPYTVPQSQPAMQVQPAAQPVGSEQTLPAEQPGGDGGDSQEVAPGASVPPTGNASSNGAGAGGRLRKRGESSASAAEEIVKVENLVPDIAPGSTSAPISSLAPLHKEFDWAPRWHTSQMDSSTLEDRQRLLHRGDASSSLSGFAAESTRQRGLSRLSDHPWIREDHHPLSAPMSPMHMERDPAHPQDHDLYENPQPTTPKSKSSQKRIRMKLKKQLEKIKEVKTEDITFALTILNTISSIPSLALTMANAYLYRGNPKVD